MFRSVAVRAENNKIFNLREGEREREDLRVGCVRRRIHSMFVFMSHRRRRRVITVNHRDLLWMDAVFVYMYRMTLGTKC